MELHHSESRERSRRASSRGLRASRSTLARHVPVRRVLADAVIWVVASAVGSLALGASPRHAAVIGLLGASVQLLIGAGTGLYRGKWRMGSFDEGRVVCAAALSGGAILVLIRFVASLFSTTIAFSGSTPFVAVTGMLLARGLRRHSNERDRRPTGDMKPVLIYGAGDGGTQLVRAMLGNRSSRFLPVALLDDDPEKKNLRIQGVPVLGTRAELADVAERTNATLLILAMPSAGARVIRDLSEIAARAGVEVRVLPPTRELVEGTVALSDIREVTEADLLGRRTIDTDLTAIAGYLTGRRVLVTGAGGSIGSELCRQIDQFKPDQLIMLDRDESALHSVQMSLEGRALLDTRNLVVADIRDAARVDEVFAEHAPQVVFHAAALKHLSLLEMYPAEGWKTNVLGTNNVLRSAAKVGVNHFVNISTDKAADPESVLGYTKRIAERLTAWYANRTRGDWVSVRFGNVLGSRGSVLQAFRAQVDAGGPLTVTHPNVTRYFMTPVEACELVIQAAAVGDRGEALVLDMGEPVKILDVAKRLAAAAPIDIDIEFTGLRPGEKLHESLVSMSELDIRRAHPLISHVPVPPIVPTQLGLFDAHSDDSARRSMVAMCDDYPDFLVV